MADTILGGVIVLLEDLGFFDVILPFLLVFTLIFGILEKTKLFGTEKVAGHEYSKKNINAMMAFVIAFFVVAAKEIVVSIQEALPIVTLILIAIISFLMLVGSFATSDKEFNFFEIFNNYWKLPLSITFLISIALIFFHSFGWLQPVLDYFMGKGSDFFIMIVFLLITGGVIYFVFSSSKGGEE
jgi:hypothetical protein